MFKERIGVSIDNSWSFQNKEGEYIGDLKLTNDGYIYSSDVRELAKSYLPNLIQKLWNRLTCPTSWFFWNEYYGSQITMYSYLWERDRTLLEKFIVKAIDDELGIHHIIAESVNVYYTTDHSLRYECVIFDNRLEKKKFNLTGVIEL